LGSLIRKCQQLVFGWSVSILVVCQTFLCPYQTPEQQKQIQSRHKNNTTTTIWKNLERYKEILLFDFIFILFEIRM